MIAQLAGALAYKSPEHLIVDVQGVGYQVFVSLQTFCRLPAAGERVSLCVHTHAREDALQLYGFLERAEKHAFLLLTGVSGIGPRLALNILSGIPVQALRRALAAADVDRLVAVPGVGKKTAERLVVELREKVGAVPGGQEAQPQGGGAEVVLEAVSALANLGYPRPDAERAVRAVMRNAGSEVAEVIREALRSLGA